MKINRIFYHQLIHPLLDFLKQGITPEKLALTLAIGVTLGIIPFIGINTALLTLLAVAFRLNLVAIQIVNYAVYALQLVLFIPFLKLGQLIFNGHDIPFSVREIISLMREDWLATVIDIWQINMYGLVVWAVLSIPLGIALYYISLPIFKKHAKRFL